MSTLTPEMLENLQLGAAEVLPAGGLEAKLKSAAGRPLRVKLGFDPTKPDLHIGHAVVLWALRRFQDAGHQIVIIIGDFTARIGDPTGKQEARPPLSKAEVEANAETYLAQLGKIVDLSKAEIRRNGEWLESMSLEGAIRLMGQATVAQMLARENFALRYGRGDAIGLHEFLYPLLQGQDSVEIQADVELGGTDQKFNNLMGRELQERAGQAPQVVMLYPILEGLGTTEKMSKSLGNYVGIDEPPDRMYEKVLNISDSQMPQYYTLASGLTAAEVKAVRTKLEAGELPARDAKHQLAWAITKLYHGAEAADHARQVAEAKSKGLKEALGEAVPEAKDIRDYAFALNLAPSHTATHKAEFGMPLARLLVAAGLVKSTSDARRMLDQNGVLVLAFDPDSHTANPVAGLGPNDVPDVPAAGLLVKVGKKNYAFVFPE